jgi:hypothetical protein
MTPSAKAPAAGKSFSIISEQKLLSLHAALLACRSAVESAADAPSKSARRPAALPLHGNEASIVAPVLDLAAGDLVVAPWPDSLLQAVNPAPSHLAIIPPLAEFAALPPGQLATIFLTGRQALTASWSKAMKQCASRKLPVIFVLLADGSSSADTHFSFKPLPEDDLGVPTITVDGRDPVALYRVASESIGRTRKGQGSSVIKCLTLNSLEPTEVMKEYMSRKGIPIPEPAPNQVQ